MSPSLDDISSYSAFPEISALAATFPHHKHVPPNLREHRVPAPGISFESPNLDVVLEDVHRDLLPLP